MGILQNSPNLWYNVWDKEPIWIIVAILCFMTSFIMFHRSVMKTDAGIVHNPIFRGYGFFIFGYGCTRIVFIFSDFERMQNGDISTLYNQFVLGAYVLGLISVLLLITLFERNILQLKKHILSWLFVSMTFTSIIFLGLTIIEPATSITLTKIFRYIMMAVSFFGVIIIIGLYFKIIKTTTGAIKNNAIITFIGVTLFFLGSTMDSEIFIQSLSIPIWLPGVFPIVGIILLLYSQRSI